MKNFSATSIAAITAVFLASGAYAADIRDGSLKDGPSVFGDAPKSVSWTGFYLGGQVGYGISTGELTSRATQDFAATPSSCWAQGNWSSVNAPTSSGQFNLDVFDGNGGTYVPGDTAVGTTPQTPDRDPRTHDVGVGASITDVTADECRDLRQDVGLIDAAGADVPNDGFTSGYDSAVAAHSVTTTDTYKSSDSGLVGGARVGYDQALGSLVVGVFGDYNWSAVDGLDGQWLVAGRAGFLVAPRTLLYGLVGYGQSDYSGVDFSGITAGAGVEFAVSNNVFLGLEYQHSFYDTETLVNTPNMKIDADMEEDRILATAKIKLNGFSR